MRSILLPLALSLFASGSGFSAPEKLKPGEFEWNPDLSPSGPLLIVCSIDDQMAYVFRNGVQIARSTGVFGTPTNPAATGVFSIHPQKPEPSRQADLPLVRQLAWTGLAIPAAGPAPRPAPFNALHLPPKLSEIIRDEVRDGATLVITRKNATPTKSATPSAVLLESSSPEESERAIPTGRPIWEPEKSPRGPLSILLSYRDHTLYVWRNGILIGQSPATFNTDVDKLPDGVFLMLDGEEPPNPKYPGITLRPWSVLSLSGADLPGDPVSEMRDSFTLPQDFSKVIDGILTPGTLFLATHHSSTKSNQSGTLGIGSIDDLPDPD